jgi:ketosteroid isomerase-like protein
MTHPNAELAQGVADALAKGDMETFFAGHAPECVVHIAGRGTGAGDHRGVGAFQQAFGAMAGVLDAPPTWSTHEVLANDDHTIVLGEQSFTRSGKTVTTPVVVVAHVTGGKFSEVWVTPVQQHELAELFA